MARPVFLTGLARGGTNILARMLIAGGASRIAIHAFQPWFKSLRNAIVAGSGRPALVAQFDPESPFGDGHFDDEQLAVQDVLHAASLDLPFDAAEWPLLLERLKSRAIHDAPDLCPGLPGLAASPDYKVMMDRVFTLVTAGHASGTELAGLIDTWVIDLFPALARAYPDAKFLVVIRDPRAIVASQLKFLETDPEGVGHVLSILRQWRKYVVLASEFQRQPLFAGRLKLVRYEDEVTEPGPFARELCAFLGLPFQGSMTDFAAYEDLAHARKWTGNSAFESGLKRIDPGPAERWRHTLPPGALAAVEFCCAPDMEACGYAPAAAGGHGANALAARQFLAEDGKRFSSWRTDTGDADADFANEAGRRSLLSGAGRSDEREIRRAFLSPAYFELLRTHGRLFPDRTHVETHP